ncbi:hypothetical protein SAMN04488107_1872 [Geodermatophilus saharensis]|uniref:Uncharacterized protein n=1 Tax=Geodermatophilus saharensis TaxID=1137994 RepID=A0A239CZ49_9ACTN|nr:hypothetical protein [Geodermatophilus saharensis]SNS24623.1 hypothetical protein SAMN04488107_1872 [Geodermatophilus saharensis]
MANLYFGTGSPIGVIDINETGALPGSRLQMGLVNQQGFAHHLISHRDICFNAANGFFFFRRNNVAGDPNNFTDLVTISQNGDMRVQGRLTATAKSFSIPHPLDPAHLRLVHGSIEGPEHAVLYRGQGRLERGTTTVTLPDYFESLTAEHGRTVQLTPLCHDDQPISALAASQVRNGSFTVRGVDSANPSQAFYWEVKAVRSDVEPLQVEVSRSPVESAAEPALV